MAIKDYSSTAADNTAISGISIQGTADVKNFDNAMRQQLADIANWTDSDTLASASTTDLGSVEGMYVTITGTTTITAFGTLKAGMVKFVKFSGALTLTHNATSLILPGAANITTAAGDTAIFVSEGSGNWRCADYQVAAYPPPIITPWVAYTPTFTAFGTPTGVSFKSRRVGGSLEVVGRFTAGTSTAITAAVTLGFNGTSANVLISGLGASDRFVCGSCAVSYTGTLVIHPLALDAEDNIKFGVQFDGRAGLTAADGSVFLPSGNSMAVCISVPIAGWN